MELFAPSTVIPYMQAQIAMNGKAMDIFASVDVNSIAMLFDVDGTLIELGPSPFEVNVPDELKAALARLSHLTNGAVALVSGRPIGDLDLLFSPLELPAIGGHGAEMRLNTEIESLAFVLSDSLRAQLAAAGALRPGIVVEDKGYSVALHYRKVPQHEAWLLRHIAAACNAHTDEPTEVLTGKMMLEVKRPSINKGEAVRHLMKRGPFAGRTPIFIGDDVTDESVFQVMPDLGGMGFSVSRQVEGLAGIFDSPANVRHAIYRLVNGRAAAP